MDIAGSNSATYDPPAGLTTTTTYTRWAHDGTCNTGFSQSTGSWVVTVNSLNPVSVTITASANPVCAGITDTFTATPANGGTPTYQWELNGVNTGTNSSVYSNSGLLNGDQISCTMTSTVSCPSNNPATSNTITMTVNSPATTSVTSGDYVWSGNTDSNWETASNWLIFNGSNYASATSIPDNRNNFV